jgi:hypothetical protein
MKVEIKKKNGKKFKKFYNYWNERKRKFFLVKNDNQIQLHYVSNNEDKTERLFCETIYLALTESQPYIL